MPNEFLNSQRCTAAVRLVLFSLVTLAASAQQVSFNRDIVPIMADTCFRCHGPDASSRQANMRLDIREEALKPHAIGTPIVPGDPDHSEIIQRIFARGLPIMPPEYAHKELTAKQKETIRLWVAQGAKYEGHWSYQPVVRVPSPNPNLNPIDAFVQERLRQEGLQPAAEADRRTLIRRVTLDLTGLIPTPEELAIFVADKSPDAYEKLVDRLLASPRYAEKRAVNWLDAARYADTAGFHSDEERPSWPYRDYVLQAFLNNMPFDQFTREQLAGDLMPNATVQQKVASAYNRMGRTSSEGGVQPKEYLAIYGADRVNALSTNWLGMTMGCSDCHDHKFDPITMKDFYSLKAFFADIKETGLVTDRGPEAYAPTMAVYKPGEKEPIDALTNQIQKAKAAIDSRADAMSSQRQAWETKLIAGAKAGDLAWKYPIPTAVSATTAKLSVETKALENGDALDARLSRTGGPGLVMVEGPNPDNETYSVTLKPGVGTWTSLALEVDQDPTLPGANVARGSDRFVITEVDASVSADGSSPLKDEPFVFAWSTTTPTTGFPAMAAIDKNPKTGWGYAGRDVNKPFLVLRFARPVSTAANATLRVRVHQDSDYRQATIGRFRIGLSNAAYPWDNNATPQPQPVVAAAGTTPVPQPPSVAPVAAAAARRAPRPSLPGLPQVLAAAILTPEYKRSAEQVTEVRDFFEYSSPELFPARLDITNLETRLDSLNAAVPKVMITEAVEPRETRILPRGNWMDDSGAVVEPAIPEFLGKLDTGGRRANRLDLANWIVSPDNPLTARVFVDRLWAEFFGIGLSRDPSDLGTQGEFPSNLKLLDWLASEFMSPQYDAAGTHKWDMKHVVRLIVLSKTYRQTSLSTPELDQRDPENRLLAHQSRFRVEAESVRDIMLEVSGLLVNKLGGPSVKPYEPMGYLAALNFPTREWSASKNGDLYRRGIYTFWQRTFLQPTMANFDAPSREQCTVSRTSSDTPLQALDLLNDPTFVEAARVFGQHILEKGGPTLNTRIAWAFQQALSRSPSSGEVRVLTDLYNQSLAHFRANPAEAAKLLKVGDAPAKGNPQEVAAMANVGRAIMNLHETITRD